VNAEIIIVFTNLHTYMYIHIRIVCLLLGWCLLCAVMYVLKLENGDRLKTIFHYLRKITDTLKIWGQKVIKMNHFKA
jgi:hypothetical protein